MLVMNGIRPSPLTAAMVDVPLKSPEVSNFTPTNESALKPSIALNLSLNPVALKSLDRINPVLGDLAKLPPSAKAHAQSQ